MLKGQLMGYARVSTQSQSLNNQNSRLTKYGVQMLFVEKFRGKDSGRSQLRAALDYGREGDALVVTKRDRLARSADICVSHESNHP
ncbi:MAG TPA: recombinase family protein [Porticoccus sp.]|nr:recombinase family protein [Porticoccus sp.]